MLRTGWEQLLPLPVVRQGQEPVGALRQPSIDASYCKHMKHQLANTRVLRIATTYFFYMKTYLLEVSMLASLHQVLFHAD